MIFYHTFYKITIQTRLFMPHLEFFYPDQLPLLPSPCILVPVTQLADCGLAMIILTRFTGSHQFLFIWMRNFAFSVSLFLSPFIVTAVRSILSINHFRHDENTTFSCFRLNLQIFAFNSITLSICINPNFSLMAAAIMSVIEIWNEDQFTSRNETPSPLAC